MEILDSVGFELWDLPWPHVSEAPRSLTPAHPTLAQPCLLSAVPSWPRRWSSPG